MNDFLPSPTPTTNCLRCGEVCRQGAPDSTKQAIVQALEGLCPACMIEKFLRSVEPIRALIEGGGVRDPLGPEIFLDHSWRENVLRPVLAGVIKHTQMHEDSINWVHVFANWGQPFPSHKKN